MTIPVPELPPLKTLVDLSGQVAMVTGGAGGIGLGIAEGLARAGALTVIADMSGEAAQRAVDSLTAAGFNAIPAQVDVTDEEIIRAAVQKVTRDHGSISILVNNAAVSTDEITEETSAEAWRRVIDVGLTGVFLCSKAVLPQMTAAGYGRIINISSLAAKRISRTHGSSYSAAKEGLQAFTRHLAYEVAGRGVTVNAVCPGPTLTPAMAGHIPEAVFHAREREIPAGRLALPEDISRVVLFLASDLADMVCGQAIDVDGGALLGWEDTEDYFRRRRGGTSQ